LIAILRAKFSTMSRTTAPAAVLFDRDGTLVVDVPYCADPDRVRPMPGARDALGAVRAAGLPVGVVTNQSGIGRGLISTAAHAAVTSRVEQLLGPFDVWRYCPHVPEDGCACRKPRPGMLLDAARALGVPPSEVAYVGDIGSDVDAARAAGARPVLVPTPVTLSTEIAAAPLVCADLPEAVAHLLGAL
jgi:D-glycero-D-manno-heptose 1,7-bisphosphate phosphatase